MHKEAADMTTVNLNIRMDEDVRKRTGALCQELWMTLSTAVNVFHSDLF